MCGTAPPSQTLIARPTHPSQQAVVLWSEHCHPAQADQITQDIQAAKQQLANQIGQVKSEVGHMRQEMRQEISQLRKEMREIMACISQLMNASETRTPTR